MNQIRDWLYIGRYRDFLHPATLATAKITATLQVAPDLPEVAEGIARLYLPIEDGTNQPPQVFEQGIRFVREQKAAGKIVLVACGAGISRSTTFALGALKEEEGGSILETFWKIREHHPDALPHIKLWHSLNQYYGEDTSYMEIWQTKPR
jgi:predicted protein tyrosine phosphatase